MRARRGRDVFVLGDERVLSDTEPASVTTPSQRSTGSERMSSALSDREGPAARESQDDTTGGLARAAAVRGIFERWVLSRSSQARHLWAPLLVAGALTAFVVAHQLTPSQRSPSGARPSDGRVARHLARPPHPTLPARRPGDRRRHPSSAAALQAAGAHAKRARDQEQLPTPAPQVPPVVATPIPSVTASFDSGTGATEADNARAGSRPATSAVVAREFGP